MKKKNYLVRLNPKGFYLARGESFASDLIEGLALVRVFQDSDTDRPTGEFSIIDTFSGLFVLRNKSKKKLIEFWNLRFYRNTDLMTIITARKTDSYKERVIELQNEIAIWRKSGYEF